MGQEVDATFYGGPLDGKVITVDETTKEYSVPRINFTASRAIGNYRLAGEEDRPLPLAFEPVKLTDIEEDVYRLFRCAKYVNDKEEVAKYFFIRQCDFARISRSLKLL